MHLAIVAFIVAAMHSFVPTSNHASYETRETTEARYEAVADDIATIVLDEAEAPLFKGEAGRAQTALLLASVASYESSFNAVTARGGSLTPGDNDGGRAVGLWQTHVYGHTEEGWTRADLAGDRQKQIRIALRRMRASFKVCQGVRLEDRLAHYATGGNACTPNEKATARMTRALRWWGSHRFQNT